MEKEYAKNFPVSWTQTDEDRCRKLANKLGLSKSGLLRFLVKEKTKKEKL